MKEFEFIKRMQSLSSKAGTLHGIGDDAVLYENMLIAKDIMVEGVHFLSSEPLQSIIERLFISNISDIAAMGGLSHEYNTLLGLAIPYFIDKSALADAIQKNVKKFNVDIIGGDTTSSLGGLFLSLTIIGKPNKYVLNRGGAKAGDTVYLSRPVGAAKQELVQHGRYITSRLPEIELGEKLGGMDTISACVDISDGLGRDLGHIAESSGVKIIIDAKSLPLPDGVNIEYAISSGEEYALAFTSAAHIDGVYAIGRVEAGNGCWLDENGRLTEISNIGYEHK